MIYGSEEQAFRRVETLKQRGTWPGVRRAGDGFELTYDPAEVAADMPAGREMGTEGRAGSRTQREPDATSRRRFEESPPKVIMAGMERVLP